MLQKGAVPHIRVSQTRYQEVQTGWVGFKFGEAYRVQPARIIYTSVKFAF